MMKTRVPGFTAGASLRDVHAGYRMQTAIHSAGSDKVVPADQCCAPCGKDLCCDDCPPPPSGDRLRFHFSRFRLAL